MDVAAVVVGGEGLADDLERGVGAALANEARQVAPGIIDKLTPEQEESLAGWSEGT